MRSDTPLPEPSPKPLALNGPMSRFLVVWATSTLMSAAATVTVFSSADRWLRRVGFFESWPERLHLVLLVAAIVAVPFAWSACSDTPLPALSPKLLTVMDGSADFLTVWVFFTLLHYATLATFAMCDAWWFGFGLFEFWSERPRVVLLAAAVVAVPFGVAIAYDGSLEGQPRVQSPNDGRVGL